jgi:hypothetical protein
MHGIKQRCAYGILGALGRLAEPRNGCTEQNVTEEAAKGNGAEAFVYVLYRDNGYGKIYSKVGSTRLSAGSRANDYTDGGWHVFDEMPIHPAIRYHVERQSHEILKNHWLDPSMTGGTAREIFSCSPEEAANAVREAYKLSSTNILKSIIRDNPDLIDFAKTTSFDSKYQKESASVSEILKNARNEVANLRKRILELENENRKLKGIYFE